LKAGVMSALTVFLRLYGMFECALEKLPADTARLLTRRDEQLRKEP
jgi:hypothetical protein